MIENLTRSNLTRALEGVVVVEAWRPKCLDCEKLGPVVEKMARKYDDVTFMSLDVRAEPVLARGLGFVDGVPALLVMRDGQRIAQNVGWDSEAVTGHFIGASLMSAGGVREFERVQRAGAAPTLSPTLSVQGISVLARGLEIEVTVKCFDPSKVDYTTVTKRGLDGRALLMEACGLIMKGMEPL